MRTRVSMTLSSCVSIAKAFLRRGVVSFRVNNKLVIECYVTSRLTPVRGISFESEKIRAMTKKDWLLPCPSNSSP